MALFLFLPLAVVFAEAFAKGVGAYLRAFADPDALSAIRLTLLTAAHRRAAQRGLRPRRGLGDRQVRVRGKSILLTLIDLPFSVSPVDLRPGLRADVRRAGLVRRRG